MSVRRSSRLSLKLVDRRSPPVQTLGQRKGLVKSKSRNVVRKTSKTVVNSDTKSADTARVASCGHSPPVSPPSLSNKRKIEEPLQLPEDSQDASNTGHEATVSTPNKRPRPANPRNTNVPLQTPGGSRIVKSYPTGLFQPSLGVAISSPKSSSITTTANLLDKACAHLIAVDPRLSPLIEKHHCALFSPAGLQETINPFDSLCSSIISQQVSGAAAASIKKKFVSLFSQSPESTEKPFPTPAQVISKDISTLRTAGLSQRKAEYIHGLADKFASGELSAQILMDASDEELLEKLIAVRGLGRWSVEMFACFALKRMDIFSVGDLGVQRGMAVYAGKDVGKLKSKGGKWKYMSQNEMLGIANRFVPYRSLFMWYMWRMEDVNVEALAG